MGIKNETFVCGKRFGVEIYSFKLILGLTDELTIANYTSGEVTATEVRVLSPVSDCCAHTCKIMTHLLNRVY